MKVEVTTHAAPPVVPPPPVYTVTLSGLTREEAVALKKIARADCRVPNVVLNDRYGYDTPTTPEGKLMTKLLTALSGALTEAGVICP